MAYLFDSNVFIAAKNLYYGTDFCPAFWEWIKIANSIGTVYSVLRVKDEIVAGDDELNAWVATLPGSFFLNPQEIDLPALQQVSTWVTSGAYEQAAVTQFLQIADYYLCAQALAGGHTVVTHETPGDGRRRIKIPNVCIGLRVSYVNTFDMLRRERARFVLYQ